MGVFPGYLKVSIVKPFLKKTDKISMTNYWPISLFTVSSKVLEKVMYNRLSHHMHISNVLAPEQLGLRKGKSTDMQPLI